MAVNGSGFFVVEPAIGQTDGASVFGGSNFYTRRGDFDINKNGYLVNGSGYYLKGLPIDPVDRQHLGFAAAGDPGLELVPAGLADDAHHLPAQLAATAQDGQYQESKTSGSELMKPQDFTTIANDTSASATGAAALTRPTRRPISRRRAIHWWCRWAPRRCRARR